MSHGMAILSISLRVIAWRPTCR